MPCYKLGLKFGQPDMVKRFLASRRTGFYFAVLQEGEVKAGDTIKLLSRDKNSVTVADITRLCAFTKDDLNLLRRAVQAEAFSENWRGYFRHQIEKFTSAAAR